MLGWRTRTPAFDTLPKICFAGGLTSLLYERQIRIFDDSKFAEPFHGFSHIADRARAQHIANGWEAKGSTQGSTSSPGAVARLMGESPFVAG